MRAQPAGRLDHAGDEHVLEVVRLSHDNGQGREQAGHLGLDDGGQDVVLAPRERPVHGGPGQPGLPGDVVDRGLGDALAGQAAQGPVDDAHPGGGAVVRAEMADDTVAPRRRGRIPDRLPLAHPLMKQYGEFCLSVNHCRRPRLSSS